MAQAGFSAQVDPGYFRSRTGTLARQIRDWAVDIDESFVQLTIQSNALQTQIVNAGMGQGEMDAHMAVWFAMRNLQLVYRGLQAQTPASNFGSAIEPACGLD